MPDLAERLREFVDTAQPAVTMDEVKETVNSSRRLAKGSTQLPPRLVFVPVMALLLLAAIVVPIVVTGGDSSNISRVAGPAAPRWSLAVDSQQPSWDVQGSANPDSYALVCPTQSDCYATGPSSTTTTNPSGVVQVSNDGGQSWHSSPIAGAGSDLFGLTCPSAQTCMVTGEDFASGSLGVTMFSTNNGGATWTAQADSWRQFGQFAPLVQLGHAMCSHHERVRTGRPRRTGSGTRNIGWRCPLVHCPVPRDVQAVCAPMSGGRALCRRRTVSGRLHHHLAYLDARIRLGSHKQRWRDDLASWPGTHSGHCDVSVMCRLPALHGSRIDHHCDRCSRPGCLLAVRHLHHNE